MLRIVSFNIWNVWRLTRRAWNRDDLAAEVLTELRTISARLDGLERGRA